MNARKQFIGAFLLLLALVLASALAVLSQQAILLVGSGSNLPSPLYAYWVEEFNKRDPSVQVHYLPLGTVQSIHDISRGVGDFGGGEVPLTDTQLHNGKTELLLVPTVLVGIVPIYNVPGTKGNLRFSGDVLAKIFLGKIKTWNDPRIAKLNPDVPLPDLPITVVHRTEGKGSNYIFTDYLSKVSAEFKAQVGRSPSPHWPLGLSANRGEDMLAKVKGTPGAVGYNERGFMARGEASVGSVQNAAGQFVMASPETIAAACLAVKKSMPADFRVSMTNAPGKDVFAISSFTWLYVPTRGSAPERARALKMFLNWVYTDGQRSAQAHGYEPLPSFVLPKVLAKVQSLQ